MAELDPIHLSDHCSIGVLRQVLLQHWFGPVLMADAEATLRAHNLAFRSGTGKVSVLVVVDGLPGLPDHDVRMALSKLTDQTAHEVSSHATVVLSRGFLGSALRSVLTAIFAMSSATYPKQVFSNVPDAVAWTAQYTTGLTPREIEAACATLQSFGEVHRRAS